ncbi:MAG: hypothetical protein ACRCYU_07610 [Nocardioides sp.]
MDSVRTSILGRPRPPSRQDAPTEVVTTASPNHTHNHEEPTKPELAVRRLLHARGLRYRVALRPIPGFQRSADIVLPTSALQYSLMVASGTLAPSPQLGKIQRGLLDG